MTAKFQVVVLGAGFGGLEVARTLSETLGEDVQTTVVDRGDAFVFGFSKLDVMFGHTDADRVRLPYTDVTGPGLQMLRAEVLAIDPQRRTVTLDSGELTADVLVVALGADLDRRLLRDWWRPGTSSTACPGPRPPGTGWRTSTADGC